MGQCVLAGALNVVCRHWCLDYAGNPNSFHDLVQSSMAFHSKGRYARSMCSFGCLHLVASEGMQVLCG